jgi:methylenetetrahydrofolate dehydrogenase (NADP+)/methenyltetrahydrofolate cyclohydrolase
MIIDGKAIAKGVEEEIRSIIQQFSERAPCLAVIVVGEETASKIYVTNKIKACHRVGISSIKKHLPPSISERELLREITELNEDDKVDGILVQLPLPHHINPTLVTEWIDPRKDVDGFHPLNVGKMLIGDTNGFLPCTPLGIKVLLDKSGIEITGKHVVILGRSNIVGKPLAALFMQNTPGYNATVTVIHKQSPNAAELCRLADILIPAIGQPLYIKADMVKEGAVVIDVGINKIADPSQKTGYKIVGDVDFEKVKGKCSHITPVPGGVGPMTIAMLLQNTLTSYQRRFI